jgi:hypothetical protein
VVLVLALQACILFVLFANLGFFGVCLCDSLGLSFFTHKVIENQQILFKFHPK